jgi:hypothetical protein
LRAIEDILLKYNQIQRRLCPNGKRKAP